MEIRFVFLAISLLLVPLVYASTSIPDACAAIRDSKYDTGSCRGTNMIRREKRVAGEYKFLDKWWEKRGARHVG